MKLTDSRRLTGPNLLLEGAGAVLEVELDGENAEQLVKAWQTQARTVLEAVGWSDSTLAHRIHPGGVTLAMSAPIDALYAATEVNEWALSGAQAELEGTKLLNPVPTPFRDSSIQGRRFDAAGTAQSSDQFAVNDIVIHAQAAPRVGMASDGSFVIIWRDEFDDHAFSVQKIYLRRFDSDGSPIAPRQLARTPFVFFTQKDIAMDGSGDFVLSWGEIAGGCTGFCMPVYAQTYDSSAVAQSGVIEVEPEESTFASLDIHLSVAIDTDGDSIVVWTACAATRTAVVSPPASAVRLLRC